MRTLLHCSMFAMVTVAACAQDPGLAPEDVGDDEPAAADDGKQDAPDGLYNFFTIRPADDGSSSWFVQRINRSVTTCSDGVARAYCTVPTVRAADGLSDDVASGALASFDSTFRGHSAPWGAYFAPALVRAELGADELVFTEFWSPLRNRQPEGSWVQLTDLHAADTRCAPADWATLCESRLNSVVAWPISIENLLAPYVLQSQERETLLSAAGHTILVGKRSYVDGLPMRELDNIYLRRTSLEP